MKVKILKYKKGTSYCYECENSGAVIAAVTVWLDIPIEEYQKINDAITWANLNPKGEWHYFILQEVEDTEEIFQSAKEFYANEAKKKEKREKEEAQQKAVRAKKSKERKLKQLEKLRKELGK